MSADDFEARCRAIGLDPEQVRSDARVFGTTAEEALERRESTFDRTPEEWLASINKKLGLQGDNRVEALLDLSGDDSGYKIVGKRGRASCSAQQIREWRYVSSKILAATGALPDEMRPAEWSRVVVRDFLRAATPVDLGSEATDAGQGRGWIAAYLDERPVLDDPNEAARTGQPFRNDGAVHVFGPHLRQWLLFHRSERVDPRRLGEVLTAAGGTNERTKVRIDGKDTTRSTWRLPADPDDVPEPDP